ncbi:MAG: pyruvate kinase [Tissierellia bacterium]|nr:pyruvate kinase [Tissierellia bacterium]
MKYFATLGPNFNSVEDLVKAIKLGLTGVRINLSHSNLKACKTWLDNIKTADEISHKKTEILLDIKGAELRIKIKKDMTLSAGDEVFISANDQVDHENTIIIDSIAMQELELGDLVHIDDGKVSLKIIDKKNHLARASLLEKATIKKGKSFSIKDKQILLPSVSDEDLDNFIYSQVYDIKSFMIPFVRSREDILMVRRALDKLNINNYTIYSKIEDIIGYEKLEEIAAFSDEVVIARGDLGNNVGLIKVSSLQKKISKYCRSIDKNFMVVTQLLNSMIENPIPTSAEINDIYNSSLDGATSLMLTGETAIGKYPLKSIEYLVNASKI